jgi:hypothetical protein
MKPPLRSGGGLCALANPSCCGINLPVHWIDNRRAARPGALYVNRRLLRNRPAEKTTARLRELPRWPPVLDQKSIHVRRQRF